VTESPRGGSAQQTAAASDPLLVRVLLWWVALARRRARLTVISILALSTVLGVYASSHLRFNVDPNALFSADLRFQKMIREFSRYFPVLTDSLLIVIDGDTPEATRGAQTLLAEALEQQSDVFHRVFLPGEEPFFERTGLLYGSVEDVEDFADQMAILQPLLGELAQDPTLPTLTRVIRLGLADFDRQGEVDAKRWEQVLDHFRSATVSVFDEYPVMVSWESVLLSDSAFDPTTLRVIVVDPVLDRERVLAADTAIETIRESARAQGLGPESGVRVRVSGYPALNHEEMIGLASDTGLAGAMSFLLVVAVLTRAYRSLRMVLAAAVTLLTGLAWAAAFAGATVAELNPLSIAFGVLVIGLGVDFIIHLGMHFSQHIRAGATVDGALDESVRDAGASLVLCAATTAVGFLAFVPTDYRGVSDLGLVASGGMIAILFLTLTVFPALLRLLFTEEARNKLAIAPPVRGVVLPRLPPIAVLVVAALLAVVAVPLVRSVDLDTNVIRLRNPSTESVQAFEQLLENRDATPWYLDALAPSLEEADRLADEMRGLAVVDRAITLSDFVPADQEEKVAVLADVAMFLDLPTIPDRPEVPAEEQIAALTALRDFLEIDPINRGESALAQSAQRLRAALDRFLERVHDDGDAAVAELESVLLDRLPDQIERLRANLDVDEIAITDLPSGLRSRMVSSDGHARIQVYPAEDLWEHDEMVRFVEAIRPIWVDITGLPVNLVESARATWASLREALILSALAITALLLALWRRVGDTLIALVPLLLAVLLTQVATVVLPVSFNFANVIVMPLMLGIGVDSGVHLVHRARRIAGPTDALLSTTTARAVLYSAITTVASFGTLAISRHRGVSSLGVLLVVGMLFTLAANLVLLPALLGLRQRHRDTH